MPRHSVVAAAGASAPKKMMTSKDANSTGTSSNAVSHAKKSTVCVTVTAVATYNVSNYDNMPPAAQAAKQADIEARRGALNAKDYAVKEDLSWQTGRGRASVKDSLN